MNKGWFNLEETSFEVYQNSKLRKIMELIKFAKQVGVCQTASADPSPQCGMSSSILLDTSRVHL